MVVKVIKDGKKYTVEELEDKYDLTEQNENITTTVDYKITGFEEDFYVITEVTNDEEGIFYFGYFLETGLIVPLNDDRMWEEVLEVFLAGYEELPQNS